LRGRCGRKNSKKVPAQQKLLEQKSCEESHLENSLRGRRGRRRRRGKGRNQRAKRVSAREGSLLLSSQYSRGRFDPFPPVLRPATQAIWKKNQATAFYYVGPIFDGKKFLLMPVPGSGSVGTIEKAVPTCREQDAKKKFMPGKLPTHPLHPPKKKISALKSSFI